MSDGELCPSGYEITSESDCIAAAYNLQLEWQGSWEGHDDFPNCLFANDGRSKVYFNLSPKPSKTVHGGMLKYAAICQKPSKLLVVLLHHQKKDNLLNGSEPLPFLVGYQLYDLDCHCTGEGDGAEVKKIIAIFTYKH